MINENELEDTLPRSIYKADGKIHEQERDVAKYWSNGVGIRLALLGVENQTGIENYMPLRIIGYDGAAYRTQLLEGQQKEKFPVLTIVLYFGYDKHWDKPLHLVDCLHIPNELKPFISDYKIHLFEIAYLEDWQVQTFQSDFHIVADYFVQMRKNKDYTPSPDTIHHVQATLNLLSVMTHDNRFEEAYNETAGGVTNMCEVLDRIENKGIEQGMKQGIEQGMKQGIEQGMKQGIEQGIEQSIQNLMETLHLTLEQAMDALKIDPSKRPFYLQKFNR